MKKGFKIELTIPAKHDLKELYLYISETLKEPDNAYRIYESIKSEILSLKDFPERYPLVNDAILVNIGLRRLFVENYVVFYIIKKETVIVLRILYNRRQWQNLLVGTTSSDSISTN